MRRESPYLPCFEDFVMVFGLTVDLDNRQEEDDDLQDEYLDGPFLSIPRIHGLFLALLWYFWHVPFGRCELNKEKQI